MVPGFAFTVLSYWYPTWIDRTIPDEYDSRIWMLIAFALRYTWWASITVMIGYAFLIFAAFRLRQIRVLVPALLGLLMFVPSVWLASTIGAAWLAH